MIFAIRDDLIQLGRDPEDGEPVFARSLYVVAEASDGRRWAHNYSVLDRKQVIDEEWGTVWVNRPAGDAEREADAVLRQVEAAYASGRNPSRANWTEIDPAYGSDAYQVLDGERFFRNREIMEAHEAGEISEHEAARRMVA